MRDKNLTAGISIVALFFVLGSTSILQLASSSARHEWLSVNVVGVQLGPHVIRQRQAGSPIYLDIEEDDGLRKWNVDAKILTNQEQHEVEQEWLGSRLYVAVDGDGNAHVPSDVLTMFLTVFAFVLMIKVLHSLKLLNKSFKSAYIVIGILMLLTALAGQGIANAFGHGPRLAVVLVNWSILAIGTLLLVIDARTRASRASFNAAAAQSGP
jgi:hypothetical protein